MEEEKKKNQTYEALFKAYTAYVQESYDVAAENLQNVYEEYLTDDMKNVYSAMCGSLGVTGLLPKVKRMAIAKADLQAVTKADPAVVKDGTF